MKTKQPFHMKKLYVLMITVACSIISVLKLIDEQNNVKLEYEKQMYKELFNFAVFSGTMTLHCKQRTVKCGRLPYISVEKKKTGGYSLLND